MSVKISLCMIVKNEEANLPACLACAVDLTDEIVVVDTGSADRTKEVASGLGARVHDFPWIDDFAAARNESMHHARGSWIFWLDADDRIDLENRARLRTLFSGLADGNDAYVMRCLCPTVSDIGPVAFDHVRLFPKHPEARWRYRIHEQILPDLERLGIGVQRTDVTILHTGYRDESLQAGKEERNLRLLHLENDEHPGDPFTLFNLAWTYQHLGRLPEALANYRQSLVRADLRQSFVPKLYAMLARVLRQLGQPDEGLNVCREGLARFPNDAELLYQQAWLLYVFGDVYGAEACLCQLLGPEVTPTGLCDFGVDPGLRGYATRNNLAVLYRDQRRFAEAEDQWQAALDEQPDFTDALLGLGELYLAQERWQEMERVQAKLQESPKAVLQADLLEAQRLLAFREFVKARDLLDKTIARYPEALGPRVLLSRVFWQEGQDRVAAEKALRDVLAMDPNHAEAKANLAWLRPDLKGQLK